MLLIFHTPQISFFRHYKEAMRNEDRYLEWGIIDETKNIQNGVETMKHVSRITGLLPSSKIAGEFL